jgi:integrase/recombinase XerD
VAEAELTAAWLAGYKTTRDIARDLREFRNTVRKSLARITTKDIADYMESLADTNAVSVNTLRRKVFTLHSFFRFAAEKGVIPHNVAAAYRNRWRRPPDDLKTISPRKIDQIIGAIRDQRDYLIVSLGYYCAMSATEIVVLKWKDIDLETGQITIRSPRRRIVEMSPDICEVLTNYRNNAAAAQPVFPSRVGGGSKMLTVRQVSRVVHDLSDVSLQVLRNSHASHAIKLGASLTEVQHMMGHQTPRSTARHASQAKTRVSETGLLLHKA